ncbi:MAG: glycosyl transferase family protein [Bryobacter sp.]|nr:glycosyl transferase family protein [Bryobacter sp.]
MAEATQAIYFALALWMILSGLDDLWLDFSYLLRRLHDGYGRLRQRPGGTANPYATPPTREELELPEQRIALWVPAWREAEVIAHMLQHNAAAIRYSNYHVFAGTYPNDDATLDVLRTLEDKYPQLHISLTPHPGPTSKADNLNWIYQTMCAVEERLGEPFDIVVIHDSEDLIHPEEFRWLNYFTRNYDFVQIPVLALPTPLYGFTHGIYCDEFAETQQKDLPTRNRLGGFSPSCGVGTGYRRTALAQLAEAEANRLFEPDSLTEDYMNGMRMHRLGLKQIYLPVFWQQGQPVATREYFPQKFSAAVRQRTRWVTGISLQTWQKVGWSHSLSENYWFWRDRKGLLGNPLSLLANLLFVLCLAGVLPKPDLSLVPWAGFGALLQGNRLLWRIYFSARVYGLLYGLVAALRVPYANLVNTLATVQAIYRFARARLRKETLAWLKTEHQYPNRASLAAYSRRLGEVLVDFGVLAQTEVEAALANKPANLRLGEHLVAQGCCGWHEVYRALSLLSGYPLESYSANELELQAVRSLPQCFCEENQLLALHHTADGLLIATSEIPGAGTLATVARYAPQGAVYSLIPPPQLAHLAQAARALSEPLALAS